MYYTYMVQCADGTFYTGITTDLERRLSEHNSSGLGAKYTSARRPVRLCWSEKHKTRSLALKKEAQIKTLKREEKIKIIRNYEKEKIGLFGY